MDGQAVGSRLRWLQCYGDENRYKAALDRQVARGRELLDQLDGVRNMMVAAHGGPTGIGAEIEEMQWTEEVERWRVTVLRSAHRHLADRDAHRARILGLPEAIAGASPARRGELCRMLVERVPVVDRHVEQIEWIPQARPFLKR